MKKISLYISLSAIVLLSFFSFKIFDDNDDFEIAKSFELFNDVIREIRLFYVEDADLSKLINESTQELLAKLDPYTIFYPEEKIEDFSFMTTGAYGGVGALIRNKENTLQLVKVYKDSPADKQGLTIGDQITEINNIKINGKNINQIKSLLKGEPGSSIDLKIKRYGIENLIKKTIIREKITIKNIPFFKLIDNKYAYLKLSAFKRGAASDVEKSITKMKAEANIEGIILDLRGNPGGFLNEAVNIVNLFVEKGSVIVSTKGKVDEWNKVYKAKKKAKFKNIPIIVLINSSSASASEIVSGAIQDLDRGIVIGQRSFGKGLVQTTRKMNYNTMIKITTAKYYIPSGRCIQAIDYSHRNEDGSLAHIPDSLVSEFKTKNGRLVYDGGGIEPDILTSIDTLNNFVKQLINKDIIFNFSTKFFLSNKTILPANEFNVSDAIYNDFRAFVKDNLNTIENESTYFINELLQSAKKEKYSNSTIQEIKKIQTSLQYSIEDATNKYKKQIIPILAESITSRFYYDEGEAIATISFDTEIKKAKETLNNKQEYYKLLKNK